MTEDHDNKGSLLVRWKDGRLATCSTASTIALSVILLATLLAAKVIVMDRAGSLIAQQNAGKLLAKIAENGLGQILGQGPLEMTYLFEKNQKPIGYGVFLIEPEMNREGELTYVGREFIYRNDFEELSYTVFVVTNDLSRFSQKKTIQRVKAGTQHTIQQVYRDGVLGGQVQLGNRRSSVAPQRVGTPGLVAPFMFDFFSGLALEENYSEGVVFLSPRIARQSESQWVFLLEQNWIKPSDEIPSGVVQAYPGGQGCSVKSIQLGDQGVEQSLYFNERHQLVWQRLGFEDGEEMIFRAIDRQDLLNQFPDALDILDRWRREPGVTDEEGEHDIL